MFDECTHQEIFHLSYSWPYFLSNAPDACINVLHFSRFDNDL